MTILVPFGFDTETFLVTEENPVPEVICVSYALGDESGVLSPEDGAALVGEVLRDPGIEIVGHNLPFDWKGLFQVDPGLEESVWAAYESGRVYDTLVAAWVDDIARGIYQGSRKGAYTLGALTARYLGEHLEKEDTRRLRYGELAGVPIPEWPEDAREYARKDAIMPVRVRGAIRTVGIGDAPDLSRQCAHHFWLSLVASHGLATDPVRVAALYDHILGEAASLISALVPLGFVSYDRKGDMHRHPGQVQKYMKAQGYPLKETPKGGVSIDAEACELSGDPLLTKYARLSRLLDAINKDSEYLGKPVVRCSYGLAESGRSTSWGPNLQNLKTETYGTT